MNFYKFECTTFNGQDSIQKTFNFSHILCMHDSVNGVIGSKLEIRNLRASITFRSRRVIAHQQ